MTKYEFDIKTGYEKLRVNFNQLPDFDLLNNEFELTSIEKHNFFLRRIRRVMIDKINFFSKTIENILYPGLQNAISGYEAGFFSDDEKKELTELHKKLVIFERRSLLLDVNYNDDNEAYLIKDLFNQWLDFKILLSKTIIKMGDSWKQDLNEAGEGYFG